VRRIGNRVRVSAQLIEAPTGRHVWAERYDRELVDIFAAQDEVTQAIVAAVAPAVGELERARARPPCCSTSAWELHQRGLWHVYRYNRDDLVSAIELFERAIAVDARFAPAHAGLAYALYAQVIWGHVAPPGPALERARRTAMRAVALDPRDAFSHVVLGRTLMTSGEVGAALTECERAVELNPNLAAAHDIVRALNDREDSPLAGQIKLLGVGAGKVAQAPLAQELKTLLASDAFGAARKGEEFREDARRFFVNYFKQVATLFTTAWNGRKYSIKTAPALRAFIRVAPDVVRRLDQEHADHADFRAIGRVIAPWGRRIGDARFEIDGAWKRQGTSIDHLAKELRLALQYPEGAM
jgi:tetratricopeptide (TPR) repeat protein